MIKKILNRNKSNFSLPLLGFVFSVAVLTILIGFTAELPDSSLGQAVVEGGSDDAGEGEPESNGGGTVVCVPTYTSCDSGWVFQHYSNCNGERTEFCGLGLCSGGECIEEEEPDTGECISDSNCNDGDPCTTDKCRNPGQPNSFCENFNNYLCEPTDACGNGICEENLGESCSSCPRDCGVCTESANITATRPVASGDKASSTFTNSTTASRTILLCSFTAEGSIVEDAPQNLYDSRIIDIPGQTSRTLTVDIDCIWQVDALAGMSASSCPATTNYSAPFLGLELLEAANGIRDCPSGNGEPTPTPPPGNNSPGGFLDLVNCDLIYGWAQDPDSPNTPVTVEIWLDGPRGSGQLYQTLTANISRENGDVGYSYGFPPDKIDGLVHSVYTYAIDNEVPSVATLLTNSGITLDTATCLDPCALVALDAQFSDDLTSSNLATSVSAIGTGDTGMIEVCYDYPPSASECVDITSTGFHQRLWPRSSEQFTVDTTVEAYAPSGELCETAVHTFTVPLTELSPCELLDFSVNFDSTLGSDVLTTIVAASWTSGVPDVEVCYTPYYPDTGDPQVECYDISDDGHDQRNWDRFTESYGISTSVTASIAEELCETAAFSYNVPGINATPTPTPAITPTPIPTATPVPAYNLTKHVRNVSLNDPIFRAEIEASPEDIIEFSIWVRGTSGIVKNLMLYDILPTGLEFIPGSIRITGNEKETGNLFTFGNRLSLGNLGAGGRITLLFKARIANEDFFLEGRTTLINEVRSTTSNAPPQTATAKVIVERIGPGDIKTGPPRNFYGPFIFDRDSYKREVYTLPIDTLDPVYDQEIFIPAIGVRVPLIEPMYDSQEIIHTTLNSGAVIYPDSADFGQYGNTIVLGHSFNLPWLGNEYAQIFSHLDKLVEGDLIRVVIDGEVFKYIVTDSQILSVKEANHVIAESTGTNTLHLLSCWPVGSSLYRIVVSAELIE